MERNYSKVPSWEFAELEQNAELNMGSFLGSSGGRDCSVDLKLGGLGDFRPAEEWKSRPMVSTTRVASSGPSKRARAPGSAGQMASCSVDGCRSDLSNSREYHRRHKVCEVHSKTPFVMVGGQEQRFCQQCSRFHLLVEFDEVKRSCRKRLDGHNRRRRKPQPESVFNPGSLFANHQGSRFSAHPRVLPTPIQALNQAVIIQTEDKLYTNNLPLLVADNQQHSLGSFLSYENRKQFPFLQYDTTAFSIATMGQSTCQPLKHISSAESSSKILSDGIAQVHSDCALSLLSSSTQDPGIGMGQMLSAGRIPMHQSLVSSLPYNNNLGLRSSSQASSYVMPTGFSFSGIEDEEVGAVFVGDDDTNLHCQSVFHVGEGSSDGVSQPLPFFWQ